MEQETTNLFRRKDTFFGICEAVGRDFGFNPLWLRLAFIPPLFVFPMETIAAYLGLGVVVLTSRLPFPIRGADAAPALTTIEPDRPARSEEHTSELQSLMRNSSAVFCLKK